MTLFADLPRPSQIQKSGKHGLNDEANGEVDSELGAEMAAVGVDGFFADAFLRPFPASISLRDQAQYFHLAPASAAPEETSPDQPSDAIQLAEPDASE